MTDLTDRLDEIEARADAATPGPWEADVTEVSQHWSRPEPWATVVSSEVHCMAYCYGGSGRGIERETDAEFIAHARTDVPALVAALRAVLSPDLDLADPPYAWETMDGWADGYETALGNARAAIAAALGVEP